MARNSFFVSIPLFNSVLFHIARNDPPPPTSGRRGGRIEVVRGNGREDESEAGDIADETGVADVEGAFFDPLV